jgi:hypothetical protein
MTLLQNPGRAWVAVVSDKGFTLGVAVEDEAGYYVTDYPSVDTYDKATKWAADLNERMGLTEKQAMLIVVSSMRKGRMK